jgi:hypothetical protein
MSASSVNSCAHVYAPVVPLLILEVTDLLVAFLPKLLDNLPDILDARLDIVDDLAEDLDVIGDVCRDRAHLWVGSLCILLIRLSVSFSSVLSWLWHALRVFASSDSAGVVVKGRWPRLSVMRTVGSQVSRLKADRGVVLLVEVKLYRQGDLVQPTRHNGVVAVGARGLGADGRWRVGGEVELWEEETYWIREW